MKTLRMASIIGFIILTIALTMSLIGWNISSSFAEDGIERSYRSTSYVFGPSYVNVFMQRSEALRNKAQQQPKSLLSRLIEVVKNKLTKDVKESTVKTPAKPKLQMKQSARNSIARTASTITTPMSPDGLVTGISNLGSGNYEITLKSGAREIVNFEDYTNKYNALWQASYDTNFFTLWDSAVAKEYSSGQAYQNALNLLLSGYKIEDVGSVAVQSTVEHIETYSLGWSIDGTEQIIVEYVENTPGIYEYMNSKYTSGDYSPVAVYDSDDPLSSNIIGYNIVLTQTISSEKFATRTTYETITQYESQYKWVAWGEWTETVWDSSVQEAHWDEASQSFQYSNGAYVTTTVTGWDYSTAVTRIGDEHAAFLETIYSVARVNAANDTTDYAANYAYEYINNQAFTATQEHYSYVINNEWANDYAALHSTFEVREAEQLTEGIPYNTAAVLSDGTVIGFGYYLLSNSNDTFYNQSASTLNAKDASLLFTMNLFGQNALSLDGVSKEPSSENFIGTDMFVLMDGNIGTVLADIVKNPDATQREVLISISGFLEEINGAQMAGVDSAEIEQAKQDLINAVADLLMAQAVPDLLNSGDIASVKAIFSDLNSAKEKMVSEFMSAAKPYYDNIVRDMEKSIEILKSNNVLNPNMTREDLKKLPPCDLEKILDKMRKTEKRIFEAEYILQQEVKYRNAYIEPNKQRLEEEMKSMMNDFTGKINGMLKNTK
ncbi:MAG: hypothetical protein PHS46_00190 [Candidatus Omnitrophica bacterium]|nr:hypothetical protein [Candidatus Omnitrophota bacterium]